MAKTKVADPAVTQEPVSISITTSPKRVPFEINGFRFEAWKVPGIAFLKLLTKLNEETSSQDQGAEMFRIFQSTMTKEEYERFEEFAINPANGVDADVLLKLIQSLVEESSGRPTEPPSSSANGGSPDGPTSEEA